MATEKKHEVKVNVRVLELSKAGSGIQSVFDMPAVFVTTCRN